MRFYRFHAAVVPSTSKRDSPGEASPALSTGSSTFLTHDFPQAVKPPFLVVHFLFYNQVMPDSTLPLAIAPDISAAILSAPGWCRVGITAPTEEMRQQSARELARAIVEYLNPVPADADAQIPLAL